MNLTLKQLNKFVTAFLLQNVGCSQSKRAVDGINKSETSKKFIVPR